MYEKTRPKQFVDRGLAIRCALWSLKYGTGVAVSKLGYGDLIGMIYSSVVSYLHVTIAKKELASFVSGILITQNSLNTSILAVTHSTVQ